MGARFIYISLIITPSLYLQSISPIIYVQVSEQVLWCTEYKRKEMRYGLVLL